MNPLFKNVGLAKEFCATCPFLFFLSLFMVYGNKMSIILVMHIVIHFQFFTKNKAWD